jgi:hypothetical protein
MVGPILRDLILEAVQDGRDRTAKEILAAVQQQEPGASEPSLRAKMSELVREGILTKLARGQYALMRVERKETAAEGLAARIARGVLKPKALARAVIWEATGYMAQAEDGAPGLRVVIEHAAADALKQAIEADWTPWVRLLGSKRPIRAPQTLAWVTKHRGPLGELLWEPDEAAPSKIDIGVVIVGPERLGGTGITPQGYRAPTHERIMAEFLTDAVDGAAAYDILRASLRHPDFRVARAVQAAQSLGVRHHLWSLLAAAYDELPRPARAAFLDRAPGFLRGFLEEDS